MEDDECPTSTRIKLVRQNIIFLEEKLKLMKDPINLISLDQIDKYWSLAHTSVDSLMDIIFSQSYYEERDYLDYLRDNLNDVIEQILRKKQQLITSTAQNINGSWTNIQHYPPTWFQGTGKEQMIQTRPRVTTKPGQYSTGSPPHIQPYTPHWVPGTGSSQCSYKFTDNMINQPSQIYHSHGQHSPFPDRSQWMRLRIIFP